MKTIARMLVASLFVFGGAQVGNAGHLSHNDATALTEHAGASMQSDMRKPMMRKKHSMKHKRMMHHRKMMRHKKMMKKRRMMRDM